MFSCRQSRSTFDTTETNREIGPVIIDFNAIQTKVNLKYDTLQKAIVQQFGTRLGEDISDFFTNVSKARTELEQQSLEIATTAEAVTFITYVQGLKRKIKAWERSVDVYRDGQKILERQRYQFPSNWLYTDNIDGEWGAFNEILKRKDGTIQTQVSNLCHIENIRFSVITNDYKSCSHTDQSDDTHFHGYEVDSIVAKNTFLNLLKNISSFNSLL